MYFLEYSQLLNILICASLGIILINAKPYSPENKAKIERSFRTIKDGWDILIGMILNH